MQGRSSPEAEVPMTAVPLAGRNLDGSAALVCLMFLSFGVQCCSLKRVIIGIIGCFRTHVLLCGFGLR